MADVHGSPGDAPQMPASDSGPAPAPYTGPSQGAGVITYAATGVSWHSPGSGEVMDGVSGNKVQESGYAHDVNAGLVTAYSPGAISPIQVHGDADAGGRDIASSTVAGAVDAREAFYAEYQADTLTQGSTIGDLMELPPMVENATAPSNDFLYGQGNQPGA